MRQNTCCWSFSLTATSGLGLVSVVAGILFVRIDAARAAERFPALGDNRLFMSVEQRRIVEEDASGHDTAVVMESTVVSDGVPDTAPLLIVRDIPIRILYNGAVVDADGSRTVWINGARFNNDLISGVTLLSVAADGRAVFQTPRETHRVSVGAAFTYWRTVTGTVP